MPTDRVLDQRKREVMAKQNRKHPLKLFLSKEQISSIIESAQAESEDEALAIRIAFNHGLRISEVLGLTAQNIVDGFLDVQRLKGSERTRQPLVPSEMDGIARLVATSNGGRLFNLSRFQMHRRFQKYCKRAGIPAVFMNNFHGLKHGHAMACLDAGADIESVRVRLGHKNIQSTLWYMNANDQSAAKACAGATL